MSSYLTPIQASAYFATRLNTGAWDYAGIDKQTKALAQATRAIDRLNFAGELVNSTQVNQFPRKNVLVLTGPNFFGEPPKVIVTQDITVPQDILDACCEIALALLNGIDPDIEAKNVPITEHHFMVVRTKKNADFVAEWTLAGIPTVTAWNLLRPYLRDSLNLTLTRVS